MAKERADARGRCLEWEAALVGTQRLPLPIQVPAEAHNGIDCAVGLRVLPEPPGKLSISHPFVRIRSKGKMSWPGPHCQASSCFPI